MVYLRTPPPDTKSLGYNYPGKDSLGNGYSPVKIPKVRNIPPWWGVGVKIPFTPGKKTQVGRGGNQTLLHRK